MGSPTFKIYILDALLVYKCCVFSNMRSSSNNCSFVGAGYSVCIMLYRPIILVSVAALVKGSALFANSASAAAQMSGLFTSSAPQVDVTIPGAGYERAFVTDKITDGEKYNVLVFGR